MKVLLFSANFRFPLRFLQYGCVAGQNVPICVCVTFDCAASELCWINLDLQLVQPRVIGLVANGRLKAPKCVVVVSVLHDSLPALGLTVDEEKHPEKNFVFIFLLNRLFNRA